MNNYSYIGKGWDSSLGGFAFDVRLAEMLADKFNINWNKKASGKGKDLKNFFQTNEYVYIYVYVETYIYIYYMYSYKYMYLH
jgi:hypothetical protein